MSTFEEMFESILEKIFKNCNTNNVFKKCISEETNHECLVMLEKPSIDFCCNETRSVTNKNTAKFRCNGLVVVTIFDLTSHILVDSILHKTVTYDNRTILTTYKVGDFVEPDSFDTDLDEVCTNGIHYFLTLKAAIGYKKKKGYCIIDGHRYDDDGNIENFGF
jgi:hypothetical protein